MGLNKFDYVNIVIINLVEMVVWYEIVLGFKLGLCLNFLFLGVWFYVGEIVVVYFVGGEVGVGLEMWLKLEYFVFFVLGC